MIFAAPAALGYHPPLASSRTIPMPALPGKPADAPAAQPPTGVAAAAAAPRPIVWPCWPPQLSLVPSSPNPAVPALGNGAAQRLYLGLPDPRCLGVDLPLRRLSDAVIRAVAKACLSFRPGCAGFDYMTINPEAHGREYSTIAALANLAAGDEGELADFLAKSHAIVLGDGYDDYPAGASTLMAAARRGTAGRVTAVTKSE